MDHGTIACNFADIGSGLLGLVAGSGSNWFKMGTYFPGTCDSFLGRVMDGWNMLRALLTVSGLAKSNLALKSLPVTHYSHTDPKLAQIAQLDPVFIVC